MHKRLQIVQSNWTITRNNGFKFWVNDSFFWSPKSEYEFKNDHFFCEIIDGILALNEHIDFKWLTAEELPHLDLAAADIPICFGDLS